MRHRSWLAVLTLVLVACTTPASDTQPVADQWEEPPAYRYILTGSCGPHVLHGRFQVTVAEGEVVEAEPLDKDARSGASEEVPTLGELLRWVDDARDRGADVAEARFASDGVPSSIEINRDRGADDDEQCFQVQRFEVVTTP